MRHLPLPLLLLACNDYELSENRMPVGDDRACAEEDAPGAGYVAQDDACVRGPVVGSFSPVVEWQWFENPTFPGYDDLMSTPAVGDITGDGVPDVVFTSFAGGAYTSAGAITAISGVDGSTHWSAMPGIYASAGVALGDLDGDGLPEVCTAGNAAAVVCLDGAGNVKWQAGTELSYIGSPALADLDGDGLAEVILGRQVFNHDGSVRWAGTAGVGYSLSFAADMDDDEALEVVAGNTVYDTDGTVLWTSGGFDGMGAVGDFDDDGRAEVVTTGNGTVTLTDDDGTVLWSVGVPQGGGGGPPTVADFDGDGAPEIGVAGAYAYSVIEGDGSTRWSMPVQDYSSSVTGSAVFDFEGDGAAEVVYGDEVTLWVFDGATGAVELAVDGHASGTLYEYPLIVDVDADGSSEIVLASNNYAFSGWNGITVIGDAASSWAASRPVWNQFAYSITNVNDDLSIPARPEKNWLSWNNFRTGGTLEGPASWLPDLTVAAIEVCADTCEDGIGTFYVRVDNRGLAAARDFLMEVVDGNGYIAVSETVARLDGGEQIVLGPYQLERGDWKGGVAARVDGANAAEECDEENQRSRTIPWPCE
jgi:hypothetical protein